MKNHLAVLSLILAFTAVLPLSNAFSTKSKASTRQYQGSDICTFDKTAITIQFAAHEGAFLNANYDPGSNQYSV